MTASQPNLIARDDTFLGVCEALGEDFGFNPIYLRIALGIGLIWNPLAVIGAYLAAGAVVAFSRLVAPNPRFAKASAGEPAAEQQPQPLQAGNDEEALAVAA
jgi:phage shock protein PspC (stress-responsive transcriptional regulator)